MPRATVNMAIKITVLHFIFDINIFPFYAGFNNFLNFLIKNIQNGVRAMPHM